MGTRPLLVLALGLVTLATFAASAILLTRRGREVLPATRHRYLVHASTAVLLLAFVIANAVAPSMVSDTLRSRLAQLGPVRHVSVSMPFPAVGGLLFGEKPNGIDVDMGVVDADRLARVQGGELGDGSALTQAARIPNAHLHLAGLRKGPISAENVDIEKHGNSIALRGDIDPAAVVGALGVPGANISVTSANNREVNLRVSMGSQGNLTLRVYAAGGALVMQVSPSKALAAQMGAPAGMSLPPQPLLQTDKLSISSFGAQVLGDRLRVSARGQLRL
jgi:hypothetical protein